MGIKTETVSTDRLSMDYFRFGHGGRTLVMLPGISPDSVMEYADAVADAYGVFTDDYTVYLFDRRKDMPETYTIRDMAEDTAEAMRALGLDHAVLMGVSQGGMIAMEMAVMYPQLADALVVGSSCGNVDAGRFGLFDKLIKLAEEGDAEKLYMAFGEVVYPPEVFGASGDAIRQAAASVSEGDLRRFAVMTEGMRDYCVLDDLPKIGCPVLVIGSETDRVIPKEASPEIAARFEGRSDCELYMYDGYGHAAYDFAPDYKERVLDFLKGH